MKNAVKRQRLPNQQQAKQHYAPLSKPLGCLKWNGFASAPLFWETHHISVFNSQFWSYSFLSTQKWCLCFKDSLNHFPVSLSSPKFILNKGQVMSYVTSQFDIVVHYGNLKRESIIFIMQPS